MGLRQEKQCGDNLTQYFIISRRDWVTFFLRLIVQGALLYKDTFWANTKFLVS